MNYLPLIFNLLRKFFYESGEYRIYYYNKKDQDTNYVDPEINVYSDYSDIPDVLKRKLLNHPFINPFYYRLKLRQAILLSIQNDREIVSYGWVQKWQPFKRKFGWIYKQAMMLGPYWTIDSQRGKGIYGRLLKQSISLSPQNFPLIIYTSPENINSQKGIDKMDFQLIGSYKINLFLRYFCYHNKIV
jgi:hypothetical protein